MNLPVNAATLVAAGILIDVVVSLSWFATIQKRYVLAAFLSFATTEVSYISYAMVLGHINMEENFEAIHWYALGCGLGTLLVFMAAKIFKRRRLEGALDEISVVPVKLVQPERLERLIGSVRFAQLGNLSSVKKI